MSSKTARGVARVDGKKRRSPKLLYGALRLSELACISGGVLWTLLPLEIHVFRFLSGLGVFTVETVWRLFPSSVLLLAVGLVGLHVRQAGSHGWLGRAGFYVALVGIALILVGDVGLYWLHVDRLWTMTAPAYRTFRVGLWVLCLGSMLIAVATLRTRVLPTWGPPPLVIGSLGGLAAFSKDLGYVGAALWMLFGAGWAWQGLASLLESGVSLWRTREPPRHKGVGGDAGQRARAPAGCRSLFWVRTRSVSGILVRGTQTFATAIAARVPPNRRSKAAGRPLRRPPGGG